MSLVKQIQALLDEEEKKRKEFIESEWYDRYDRCDIGGVSVLDGKIDAYKKVLKLIIEEENE
tara:strand:+ start:320 stop:505 length:186 start_codon:yes stop_codon:yes gene_type:complete